MRETDLEDKPLTRAIVLAAETEHATVFHHLIVSIDQVWVVKMPSA